MNKPIVPYSQDTTLQNQNQNLNYCDVINLGIQTRFSFFRTSAQDRQTIKSSKYVVVYVVIYDVRFRTQSFERPYIFCSVDPSVSINCVPSNTTRIVQFVALTFPLFTSSLFYCSQYLYYSSSFPICQCQSWI